MRMPVPKGAEILRATEGERREGERRAAGVEDHDEAWKLEEIIFGNCNAQTVSCQLFSRNNTSGVMYFSQLPILSPNRVCELNLR